jgi:hypothetical protein
MTNPVPITDTELEVLIETYCFQSPSALSIHQKQVLVALQELKAFRTMTGRPAHEIPPADRVTEALQVIHAAGYRIAGPVLSPQAYAQHVDDNTPYLVKVAEAYPDGPIAKMLGMNRA